MEEQLMNTSNEKRASFRAIDLTTGALFIALMAIAANLTAIITIGAVPLTLQTFVATLAGIILGKKLGSFAMIGYTLVGLIGAPVFAQFNGGLQVIVLPTFGFILSFIALAYVAGLIVEKAKETTLITYLMACIAALFINYGIGVPYLYFYSVIVAGISEVSFWIIVVSMTPFFIKDAILAMVAAFICPKIVNVINRSSSAQRHLSA